MRLTTLSAAILVLSTTGCATVQTGQNTPLNQPAKGALGAVVGGVIGNQIGNGRGRTAATATGAALGVVIASGCKVSAGTAAGGLIGGLLGSQIGGGNGKNTMAGLGAALGAFFGSDCSPGANPAKPQPIPNMTPLVINGLKVTPITGFSPEAFSGVPPIVTPQDIQAAATAVKQFSKIAKQAQAAGNTELSILSMYWAKRISTVTVGILTASLQSITTNTGTTASIPAKGLVILPAFNQHRESESTAMQALLKELKDTFQTANYPTQSVQVADNSGFANALNFLQKINTPQPGQATTSAQSPSQTNANAQITATQTLAGFPKNIVLQLPDGTQILKTDESLTIYNPNDKPISLPLEKLDFMPRTPDLSPARQAAADLMFKIREGHMAWVFGTYAKQSGLFNTIARSPNNLVDLSNGGKTIAYFSQSGDIDTTPTSGAQAYKKQASYKRAMDTLNAVDKASSPVRAKINICMSGSHSSFTVLAGKFANQIQAKCFDGSYSAPRIFSTKTFYIGENKEIIQTMESLMKDKKIQKTMKKALDEGEAASDLLSFAGMVGNVESGLQCIDTYTMTQYAAIAKEFGGANLKQSFDIAKLSGWAPPDSAEWDFDRITACVGAIPLLGTAAVGVKGVGKLATRAGYTALTGLGPRVDAMRKLIAIFDTPTTFKQFVNGVRDTSQLVPGNPVATGFVKGIYDSVMTGQSMSQTFGGGQFFNDTLASVSQ